MKKRVQNVSEMVSSVITPDWLILTGTLFGLTFMALFTLAVHADELSAAAAQPVEQIPTF